MKKVRMMNMLDNSFIMDFPMPLSIADGTDIEVRATAIISGANVTAGFVGWFE